MCETDRSTSGLQILTYPHEILLKPTKTIYEIDGRIQRMIEQMAQTMYRAHGIGLAANQVGWDESLTVYDIAPLQGERALHVLINPKIIEREGDILFEDEGCLSMPDYRSNVKRSERVLVEGLDREGKSVRIEAEGLHAVVLQHEIDHLEGHLFIDRISSLKRELFKRRIKRESAKRELART